LWYLEAQILFISRKILIRESKTRAELTHEMAGDDGKETTEWIRVDDGSFETLVQAHRESYM
jgi:hypothetical protein